MSRTLLLNFLISSVDYAKQRNRHTIIDGTKCPTQQDDSNMRKKPAPLLADSLSKTLQQLEATGKLTRVG